MKKAYSFLVLFLITLPTLIPFFNSNFFYTQDHIFIARLNQISTALSDGHFPVRWSPDLRLGEPLFNFYAPLPYYLGAAIKLLGFNFIWVAKILFILSSILSAITMYILTKKLFSKKGAILATTLYVYAPYRAVDIYVRGALSEVWAFVFFPLIFYLSVLLAEKVSFLRLSFLALSLAGLFLTHNVTTLIFLPFLVIWIIFLAITKAQNIKETRKKIQRFFVIILHFCVALILGLGLAAFFLLPALIERQFIQTKYLLVGYFDFRAHFVAFYQFFSPVFGYGSSLWGPKDDISFQIGLIHWAIMLLALYLGYIFRKDRKLLGLLLFLFITFLLSLILQHNKSAFFWEAIPIMAFIQFPWRFLAVSIFLVSITGGAITDYFKNRFAYVYFILIALTIFVNLQYFKPRNYVDDSFFDKFLNKVSMQKGVDLTKDYLPIWVESIDGEVFSTLRQERGKILVSEFSKKTTSTFASIVVLEDSLIEAPITYFPGWQVFANGNNTKLSSPSREGLIRFELPKGNYQVKIEFKDTPVRTVGNIISLISLATLIGAFVIKRKKLHG